MYLILLSALFCNIAEYHTGVLYPTPRHDHLLLGPALTQI